MRRNYCEELRERLRKSPLRIQSFEAGQKSQMKELYQSWAGMWGEVLCTRNQGTNLFLGAENMM
jgi:hypothetical protein